jgi:hypothetical protein
VAQVFFLMVLRDNGRLAFQGLEYLVFKRIIEKKKLTDIGLVGFFRTIGPVGFLGLVFLWSFSWILV